MAAMAPAQELEVQQKRQLIKKQETTTPVRTYLPNTDIYETKDALMVVMEMPGVDKEHADITVEDNVLSVVGRIDFSKYEKLQPVYTEYNIGHYGRSFSLAPSSIDEHKIIANMKDGVLTLTLPKAERVKPRRVELK
jgi:HSP20 family molecular chaperone IbpA